MMRFVLLCLLIPSLAHAGLWKKSLNFKLDDIHFDYVDTFHAGLRQREQIECEKVPGETRLPGGLQAVYSDNVGNLLFRDLSLYQKYTTPTNKENIALASLQVITKGASPLKSSFVHLEDEIGGRHIQRTRFFKSTQSRLSAQAYDRLFEKMRSDTPSKPNTFDHDVYKYYHKSAHSEDKIFYLLSQEFESLIEGATAGLDPKTDKICAVILHIHTRFDMCGSCAYALDWELDDRNKNGFGYKIFDFVQHRNRDHQLPVNVSAIVSSRQEHLVWGPSQNIT